MSTKATSPMPVSLVRTPTMGLKDIDSVDSDVSGMKEDLGIKGNEYNYMQSQLSLPHAPTF